MLRYVVAVDPSNCSICAKCVTLCPNEALEIRIEQVALVNEALCMGDGLCVDGPRCGALWLQLREAAPYDPAAARARKKKRESLRALAGEG